MMADAKVTSSCPSTAMVVASLNRPVPLHPVDAVCLEEQGDSAGHLLETPSFHAFAAPKSSCGAPTVTPSRAKVSSAAFSAERRLHPGLRRNAPDTEARAAELCLLLDAHDLRAQLRCSDCGRVAARPAPEDGDVAFHASILSTRLLPAVVTEIALFTDDVEALVGFYRGRVGARADSILAGVGRRSTSTASRCSSTCAETPQEGMPPNADHFAIRVERRGCRGGAARDRGEGL